MSTIVIQKSFSAGEWAPELNARVDLAKYHSAAAVLRNFFVDYRGGATTRPGTRYILQAFKSSTKVRLIPFQASFTVNYVLEFGNFYIRFFTNGAPILEAGFAITAATQANPCVVTFSGGPPWNNGDWIFISGVGGMTQLDGNYYILSNVGGGNATLNDLYGNSINSTGYGAYTSGGTGSRVYTLASPFASADLALVKFTQSVNSLILCHPSYQPQVLTLVSAANWTITAINFGPTIGSPTNVAVAQAAIAGGTGWYYAYAVTAVDNNGQESNISSIATLANSAGMNNSTAMPTNTVSWTAVSGAASYNVYKAYSTSAGAVPGGVDLGFVGNVTGTSFAEAFPGIAPDFSQSIPIVQNPFAGASVIGLNLTGNANYTTVPAVTIAAPAAGVTATGQVSLAVVTAAINNGGSSYSIGNTINLGNGVILLVTNVAGTTVTAVNIINAGSLTGVGNTTPSNPVADLRPGVGAATFNLTWHIGSLILVQGGFGYLSTPAVTFSAGAATATSTLGPASAGNPSVPGFFDERLVLASQPQAQQTFYMSQPGSPYNFNISNPIQADDAITGAIVSGKLNTIKSMLAAPTGLIMFTSQQAWLVNGGQTGAPVTPADVAARGHAYNGASDVPPIQINFDYLYVQSKGSIVRDLTYNFYTQIFTGTDVSVLSSHLFFGHQILEWAYAEVPFSVVWAVREDGVLLSLTFVKEQETVGWSHSDTKGLFQSITSVPEPILSYGSSVQGTVDAVYVVVQRIVNGQTLQYIERMADRFTPYGAEDCWALDAALTTVPISSGSVSSTTATPVSAGLGPIVVNWSASIGLTGADIGKIVRVGGGIGAITAVGSNSQATVNFTRAPTLITPDDPTNAPLPDPNWTGWAVPKTTFTGLQHLTGQTVTALADGIAAPGLVVSATGSITLANAASKVIIGLPFTPQLQTLAIDVGDPTIQSKLKNIPFSALRVRNTLGLSMGRNFSTVIPMKDLQLGAIGSMLTGLPAAQQTVTDLYTGDATTFMDSAFTTQGQYCIEQDQPYYATVLGTIPALTVGR